MLYRSRHIFILMSGLLHVGIGSYFKYRLQSWRRVLQFIGSLLITIATVVFTIAFFYEPGLPELQNPLSLSATISTAVGVLLHLISGAKDSGRGREQVQEP